MDRLSRVGWNGTPHYRWPGGRFLAGGIVLFGGREMMESILVDLTNANIQSLEMA